ncbi:hypothetical protein U1Q18_052685 [Sarracenia purpurea var. burkii]
MLLISQAAALEYQCILGMANFYDNWLQEQQKVRSLIKELEASQQQVRSLAEIAKKNAESYRKVAYEKNAAVEAFKARDFQVNLLKEELEKERADFETRVAERIEQHMSSTDVRIQIGQH